MDKVFCSSVWFSTAQEQKSFALAKGADPKNIYTEGEGAENFDALVRSFRDHGGRVGLVGGFYILGQTSDKLKERLAILRKAKIVPFDFESGETDGAKLYGIAMGSILGSRKFKGDKKRHKRVSSKGGNRKGEAMQAMRDGIAAGWLLQNIARCEWLTWEQKVKLLDGKISEATLRRHYL